jgi:hypothetical protein
VTFSSGKLDSAQLSLFRDQLARAAGIAGHEDAKGETKIFEDTLIKFIDFRCAVA